MLQSEHTFEDEAGNEIALTDNTWEVIKTYVDPITFGEEHGIIGLVFTHVVKLRDNTLDLELLTLGHDN